MVSKLEILEQKVDELTKMITETKMLKQDVFEIDQKMKAFGNIRKEDINTLLDIYKKIDALETTFYTKTIDKFQDLEILIKKVNKQKLQDVYISSLIIVLFLLYFFNFLMN